MEILHLSLSKQILGGPYILYIKNKTRCKWNYQECHLYQEGYPAAVQVFCMNLSFVCACPLCSDEAHIFGPCRLRGLGIIIKQVCKETARVITLGLSLEIPLQLFNIHKNLAEDS